MSTEGSESWGVVPGTPCWIEIPAIDVLRAKAFYAAAFDWTYKPGNEEYPEHELAMFVVPDPGLRKLGGGIKAAGPDYKPSVGGTVVYLWVESIEGALEKINKAGGTVVQDKTPEGSHGYLAKFADTEGNVHGIYTMKT